MKNIFNHLRFSVSNQLYAVFIYMKQKEDILAVDKELKKMPYSVPDGYFDSFKKKAMSSVTATDGSLWRKVYPVVAMAAMFIAIVTGGTFLMKASMPSEQMSLEDYFVWSGLEVSASEYNSYGTQLAEAEISGEDIVQYLIYMGVEAESLGED